jgi:DNA-binding SARP family transcriptional activator/tetratricopeptide (TPR) repeat protein
MLSPAETGWPGGDRVVDCRTELEVFGSITARVGDSVVRIPQGRALHVVALLAARAPRPVDDDVLIDRLWRSPPPTNAIATLRNTVSRLRQLLGRESIIRVRHGYVLGEVTLDVERFDAHARRGQEAHQRGELEEAIDELTMARAIASGRPYDDIEDPDVDADRMRLDERVAAVEDAWADAIVSTRRARDHLDALHRLARERPEREQRWVHLVDGYLSAGRRTEAVRASTEAALSLAEFGMEPGPELTAAGVQALGTTQLRTARVPVSRGPLLGRQRELEVVLAACRHHEVVTICGMGGIGKTRLALEAARRHADCGSAVVFCDLVAAAGRADVLRELTTALARGSGDGGHTVKDLIGHAASLIAAEDIGLVVFDNAEHVAAELAHEIVELGRRGAACTYLVTSRCPLELPNEHHIVLGGLPVPAESADGWQDNPAIQLLEIHAEGIHERTDLAEIARMLEGVPLALEIAGRLLGNVAASDLLMALDHGRASELLVDDSRDQRQRSLETVIDWSMERLADDARAVVEATAVLPGPFTAATAEALAPHGSRHVLVGLAELVRAGVCEQVERRGTTPQPGRYRHRVVFRERILREARASGAAGLLQERADRHYHERMCELGPRSRGADQTAAVTALYAEAGAYVALANRLAEQAAAGTGDPERAAEFAVAAAPYWFVSAQASAAYPFLRAARRHLPPGASARAVVAHAECVGTMAGIAGLRDELTAAAEILRSPREAGLAHLYAAIGSMWHAQREDYRSHMAAAESIASGSGDDWLGAGVVLHRGVARGNRGDHEGFADAVAESRRLYLRAGDRARAATAQLYAGMWFQRHGFFAEARGALVDAENLSGELPMHGMRVHVRYLLALCDFEDGRLDEALPALDRVRSDFRRAGDIGCLNGCNRMLARHALDHVGAAEAVSFLADSVQAIAKIDQQEFALSLNLYAEIFERCGDLRAARTASRHALAGINGTGIGLNDEQRQQIQRLADRLLVRAEGDTIGDELPPEIADAAARLVASTSGRRTGE